MSLKGLLQSAEDVNFTLEVLRKLFFHHEAGAKSSNSNRYTVTPRYHRELTKDIREAQRRLKRILD